MSGKMTNIFHVKELKYDFILSVIIGTLSLSIIYYFRLHFIFNNLSQTLEEILTVSVTLAGFLITSLTILFVFPENARIKFIKKHSTYKYIFDAFMISIILFILTAILCFVFTILTPDVPSYLLSVLIVLLIWALVSLFRCLWLLKRLIGVYFHKSGVGSE